MTEIVKQTAASPRPDFLARCQAKWNAPSTGGGDPVAVSAAAARDMVRRMDTFDLESLGLPTEADLEVYETALAAARDNVVTVRRLGDGTPLFPAGMVTGVCTGPEAVVREGRKSFPSGHSSSAMFSTLFPALVMWRQWTTSADLVLRQAIQVILISFGLFVCASRYADCWHRPIDILLGGLLGVVSAVWAEQVTAARFNVALLLPTMRERLRDAAAPMAESGELLDEVITGEGTSCIVAPANGDAALNMLMADPRAVDQLRYQGGYAQACDEAAYAVQGAVHRPLGRQTGLP